MGLGMFWWSKRCKLLNLSLIYEIMKICEKKLSPLSTGTLPAATMLSQLGQIKQWTLYTFWAAFLGTPLCLKSKFIIDLLFQVQMYP